MLTVLIATHDGADTLPEVLAAHSRLEPPPGGWKLIVVDNASTDATGEVVRSFAARLPLTYLFEPKQGQNAARNRGLSEVEGDLLVLTDDDAIPRRDWLVRLRSAADEHRGFGIFGGVVRPRWSVPPDPRLLRWAPLQPCFALTDPAWEEGPIKSDFVFSPNMVVRAELFLDGRRFDESIGPRRGSYPMGSETELTRRLTREGIRAWHVRDAVVEHAIQPGQMTIEWVLARAVRYGRGQQRWRSAERPRGLVAAAPSLLRDWASLTARIALARGRGDEEETLRRRWDRNCVVGRAREALDQTLGGRTGSRAARA
jgi:glycosyltransferase involved in cell wall biosynthesis